MMFRRTLLLAAAAALVAVPNSQAQYMQPAPVFQMNPQLGQAMQYRAAMLNQGIFGQGIAPATLPGLPSLGGGSLVNYQMPTTNPAYNQGYNPNYYPGYYPPYYYDPAGGFLRGLSDLTVSYGQYQKDYQQARLLNEEVQRSRIETRRRLIEEWRYMQSLIPTAEEVRRLNIERDLARARKQAPIGEILAGNSLNVLYAQLRSAHTKGIRGPALPLNDELLEHINVTSEFGGNIGLIKTGKVNWPMALREPIFAKYREKIDTALEDAVNRARINGKVDLVVMKDLDAARKGMEATLDKLSIDQESKPGEDKLSFSQFIEARRYLDYLGDSLRALQDPNVAKYFNGTYRARGKTIGDLIDYMVREGLKFSPAMPGDEAMYRSLYTLLSAYDEAMNPQLVGREKP